MLPPLLLQVTTLRHSKRSQKAKKGKWTSRDLMAAILYGKGPVCSLTSVSRNGPQCLRHITAKQFKNACEGLKKAGFGELHKKIFVKKFPSEVMAALGANTDLLTADEYTSIFYMPKPSCIRFATCEKLVKCGHATKDHFYWGMTTADCTTSLSAHLKAHGHELVEKPSKT